MKESKLINVSNDFRTERFNVLCEELEQGERVQIYVACIGHTRKVWVEEEYAKQLQKKYGERLCIEEGQWETVYFLKGVETE